MIEDFCNLIRAQNFDGLVGGHAFRLPQGATGCRAVVKRDNTDKLNSLDGADDTLKIVSLTVEVTSETPEETTPVAEGIELYFDDYNGALGGTYVTNVEDFEEEPQDGSDNWRAGVRLTVTVEHTPS